MSTTMLLNFGTNEIIAVSVCGAIFIGFIIYLCFVPIKNWFTALFGGAYIPTFKLVSMKNRKVDVSKIVNSYILAKKSKHNIKLRQIESFVQNGGNIDEVLKAIDAATCGGLKLNFPLACSIDLANHNIMECVQNAINSKVIIVDDVRGYTKDEKEVIALAKVSVKVNFEKYIKGLGEEDLKAAVSAWILQNIAKTSNYKEILADPNKTLLSTFDLRLFGKKSKFDVQDISITRVEIGKDLKIEKDIQLAEKEKAYARVEAERRKNAEEIKEIQMRAKTEQMKSAILEAEADVPKALSQAIKEGRFSVMDYYKLMNLQADTALRRSIMASDNKSSSDFDDGDLFE